MSYDKNLAIITVNISKKFGKLLAVSGVNLEIPRGQIYALIGPNGVGKTTLIKILVGLLAPTTGTVKLNGFDIQTQPVESKQQFVYISDNPEAYDYLTGEEFLAFSGRLRGIPSLELKKRIHQLISLFPIKDIIKQRMNNYSRGNRQKVAFLSGLIAQPAIFIIDEPIVGLDPVSIKIFGNKLREFAKMGGTVLFSTHILTFAKSYADKVGIMVKGKIIRQIELLPQVKIDKFYQELTGEIV